MRFVYVFVFLSLSFLSNAQIHHHSIPGYRYLKVSGGRVLFGTGDVPGYGIYTEYSFQLGKQDRSYWRHFQLGGELGFETGAVQPNGISTSLSTAFESFHHVSNTSLYAKISYFPLGKSFLKGLNVSLGPTTGYILRSEEGLVIVSVQSDGTILRSSYLNHNNYTFIGYRISAGYEYYFKKLLIGARLDWNNNQKGDINTMYGAKIGWKL